jgi:hypothetical protein
VSEANIVEVIYRALRDSISNNISHVDFDKKKSIIHLTLKGEVLPYPYGEENDSNKEFFDEAIWKISKDGIENTVVKKDKKKKSWIKSLFKS